MQKNFEHLYTFVLSEHRVKISVLIFLLTAVSLWGIWGFQMDGDFTALLDPSDKTVQEYQDVLENFPGTDAFVLVIPRVKLPKEILNEFLTQLQTLPGVSSVEAVSEMPMAISKAKSDSASIIILVKPIFRPTVFSQSRPLSQAIHSAAGQFNIPIGLTGSYQVLIESADAANRDMFRAGLATLAGILVLLLLVFRIPWIIVLSMAGALCVGLCWTLALTRLVLGELNLLTATLPSVILGLGVDFSLYMIYAFHEKASLLSAADAGDRMQTRKAFLSYVFSKTYKPLLIGAVTTAAAFLALCFAKSRGLYHMGLMGAIGIGCTFAAATGLLPIVLTWIPVRILLRIRRAQGRWLCDSKALSSKGRLLTAVVLILILSGLGVLRVRFSSDQNKLADQTLPAYILQNQLQDEFGLSFVPIAFVSPDRETEQSKLLFLQSLPDSPFGLILSEGFARLLNQPTDLFVGRDGTYLTLAYPVNNAFESAVFERIETAAEQCRQQFPAPGNRVTGSPFLNAGLHRMIRTDLARCSMLAGLFVFLLVLSYFRSVPRTLLAMLPVALGTVLMIGFMGYMNIDFTMMTVVIVPLVIGSGIDYGVHILSRWYLEQKDTLQALRRVVTPVIGAILTSMIGFGSLILSDTPGFRQLGLVAMAGLGFCLLISLFVLPQILNVFESNRSA